MSYDIELAEEKLVNARNRAEEAINCALEWIERYYQKAGPGLIPRLTGGIRSLTSAMQQRSADDIDHAIESLLETQSVPLLGGSEKEPASAVSVPRIHDDWTESDYFDPNTHVDRPKKQKLGPVVVSYSRADSAWLNRLKIHLRPLERAGRIDLWHDGKIKTGENWRKEISRAVNNASSAILLVSANFMASDFIFDNELQPIAKRARDGGVVVFPVIVGHCLFDEDEYLSDFQMFNDPERPLTRLDSTEVDTVLVRLSKAVLKLGKTDHDGK